MQPTNVFYGGARLLKRHAGLPERQPLYASLEHGVSLREIWPVDLQTPLPLFLCASPERAEQFESEAGDGRRALAIGPAIAYAPPPPEAARDPGGTLVAFPAHSTHHVDADFDVPRFARRVAAYRERFNQVEVCLYWKDVLRGLDRPYRDAGLTVVTAGHIYDQAFLTRLRAILERADVVATNEVGTHIFYAAHLGRPVWMLEQEIAYTDGYRTQDSPTVTEVREAFHGQTNTLTAEQQAIAARWSGSGSERSRAELRAALDQARAEYRERYSVPVRVLRRAHRTASAPWNALLGMLGVDLIREPLQ